MGGIVAVTIDFWNTLVDETGAPERRVERRDALVAELAAVGRSVDDEQFDAAQQGTLRYFQHHWLEQRRTPHARELVGVMLRELDAALPDEAVERVAHVFAQGVLSHPPRLLPGAREALAELAGRARLAIISDTAFSPGAVLRALLEREGVAGHFTSFVFSDETGVAKPEPEAFARALDALGAEPARAVHIGDLERTDIVGARGAGMRSILFRAHEHLHALAEEETEADAVVAGWHEVGAAVDALGRR